MALSLHDIRDCEAHISSRLQTMPAFLALSVHDREDAIQEMLLVAFALSQEYSPDCGYSFSTMLGRQLPNRFVDYLRKHFGDSRYQRTRQLERLATAKELGGDQEQSRYDNWSGDSIFDVPVYDEYENEDEAPDIETDNLSERGLETLVNYALPMRKGSFIEDLSELHGESPSMIRKRLRDLKDETSQLQ